MGETCFYSLKCTLAPSKSRKFACKITLPMNQPDVKLYSFGSGSSGNSYYLWYKGQGLIIDLGLSLRTFKKHFRTYGLSFGQVLGILVTHDPTDHVKAVGALSTELHLPVYTSQGVHEGIARNRFVTKKVQAEQKRVLEQGKSQEIGPFCITSFAVPHDSADNNGYLIRFGDHALCLITDAGEVTEEMGHYLAQAENIIIESNYDPKMLENGPYPWHLKHRILSENGHLCNSAAGEALRQYSPNSLRRVWLCHLSEENNHPELARAAVRQALESCGHTLEGESAVLLHAFRRQVPDYFEW